MFGLELSVLIALQSGNALCAERPFYPADSARPQRACAAPRVLVSTPVHLRTLLAAGVELPAVDLVVSLHRAAVAGVSPVTVEAALCHALDRDLWVDRNRSDRLAPHGADARLAVMAGGEAHDRRRQAWAQADIVEQPTLMCDMLEACSMHTTFCCTGEPPIWSISPANAAPSPISNHQLHSVPGVIDGAFVLREDESVFPRIGVTRLAAMVVAPALDASTLARSLRERIDPAFLPRPLLFVEKLPRNATGKLTRDALQALLLAPQKSARLALIAAMKGETTLAISPQSPGLCRAFPRHADRSRGGAAR